MTCARKFWQLRSPLGLLKKQSRSLQLHCHIQILCSKDGSALRRNSEARACCPQLTRCYRCRRHGCCDLQGGFKAPARQDRRKSAMARASSATQPTARVSTVSGRPLARDGRAPEDEGGFVPGTAGTIVGNAPDRSFKVRPLRHGAQQLCPGRSGVLASWMAMGQGRAIDRRLPLPLN